MKPSGNVNRFFKNAAIDTNPKMDEAVLDKVLTAHEKTKNTMSALAQPALRRQIMKSPITRLAAAAIVITVALIGINQFGGSIDGANVAFGRIKQAVENVPWVHSVNSNSNCSDEGWLSFVQQIEINKKTDGKVTYTDYRKKVKYVYSPDTETITLSDISNKKFALGATDLFSLIEAYLDNERARGAELTRQNGLYHDMPVEILAITRSENNWTEEIKIFLNTESYLPLAVEVESGNLNGESSYVGRVTFDYPESGPRDIYALGVPQSARIIDLLPEPDALEVLHTYQEYRDNAPSKYGAVVIFDTEGSVMVEEDVIGCATIIYSDEQRQYGEQYKIIGTPDEYAHQIGDTFESAMNWCRRSDLAKPNVVDLFDGVYHYQTQYDEGDNRWSLQPREDCPGDERGNYLKVLRRKGWPGIVPKAENSPPHQIRIIEDHYSQKYGLICIELLRQGANYGGRIKAMPPIRELYYLNPQKDYICQRLEHYRRRNAPWQEDSSWLDGIDPDNVRPDATTITQVTEYGQTSYGQWYPKVVTSTIVGVREDSTPGVFTTTETIHLETAPEFPDRIFDPENLPT
ncbi:MAG: hypothetical protein AMJ65_10085 [Phycisphaerae bacterium SG8_4]|nr:MAG: hypothetical protein AMJ65_10085 [Phycisphaerae bacterium SG8_4]